MLEVRIRFWTNAIADKDEHVVPKHAWDSGVVLIDRNETHGITPQAPVPFNSLLHLPAVIERVLIKQGVKLHHARSRKYYAEITR